MHGFPYDIHAYAEVAPRLAESGCRVIVPYLRGYGPTRFLHATTPRSGEQAALGADLLALMDALAALRALCWPATTGGAAPAASSPRSGRSAAAAWFRSTATTSSITRARWSRTRRKTSAGSGTSTTSIRNADAKACAVTGAALPDCSGALWSPVWDFDDATFERSAVAFENPDFIDVVIHSYRHRYGLVDGDPAYAAVEQSLAGQPPITVPAITFDGTDDGVRPPSPASAHAHRFTGGREHRVLPKVGHNLPQEAPAAFADAVLQLVRTT